MLDDLKGVRFNEPVQINKTDVAVATKLGLTLEEGYFKTAIVDEVTGVVKFSDTPSVTPPAFSSDRFLVNTMADFANANEITLPKWTAEPQKIAQAIADWEA